MADNPLRRLAGRGAMWQVLAGGWQALVRLGASTILARTLAPADFGLFGMALLIVELVDYLGSLGMTAGVIAKKEVSDKELSTCFWTMAGIRLLLFCIAFAAAPFAAVFMNEPRVEAVVRVVSCTFLISILSITSNAILSRKMQFGKISIIDAVAILLESLLAVYLAKTTSLGYWALVYPMLVANLFSKLSLFIVAGWLPKFIFDKESFKFQFRFGIHGLGFNIANYLHQNLDYFMVGRLLGTTALGLYEYAYRIPHIVLDRLARPVGAVVFPALSRVQDDDDALIRGYVETVRYVTVVAFPLLGGLIAIAEPLVHILWGKQWHSIVIPLQILSLCAALRCCVQPIGAVFLCKHRPDIPFKQSVISCIATAILVFVGISFYDVNGVALGMLFSTVSYIYALRIAFKITKNPLKLLYYTIFPSFLSATVSSAFAYMSYCLLHKNNSIETLISSIVVGCIFYLGSYYIFFKKDFLKIYNFFRFALLCSNKNENCQKK